MPLTFSTTAAQAQSAGVKVCVHGRSGAGKTVLCSTCPRPIILSPERGTLSIAKHNIPVILIASISDLAEAYAWATTSKERANFDTFCIDSISEIAERILADEKRKAKDPRQAYGELSDQLQAFVRLWRDIPGMNVYMTSKSELREQPDHTVLYSASLPGKANGQGLAFYFDEFFYLGIGEYDDTRPGASLGAKLQYRYLQTQLDSRIDAKDRSGVLAPIEEPHLGKIFDKIRAGLAVK